MTYDFYGNAVFSRLIGETLKKIVDLKKDSEDVRFYTESGKVYRMHYLQDCCATCSIEDINGDIDDLIGTPILMAEVATSDGNPEGVAVEYQDDSFTWTFYKLATIKGYVTIRWYGSSNGYYSESVTFEEVPG